jgi:hypothetical protein
VTWSRRQRLFAQLYAIAEQEQLEARARADEFGIDHPIRTGFKPSHQLPVEIDRACQRVWDAGSLPDGRCDPVLRRVYQMAGKGLLSLTEEDFIKFSKLTPAQMRAVGCWLIRGATYAQGIWNTRGTK